MTEIKTFSHKLDIKTLSDSIRNAIHLYGERPYLGVKKAGVYTWMTYSEFDIKMRKMRSLLKSIGFEKGDRLAIVANNSIEFAVSAYAAYGLGGIVVPMYEVQKLQDWEYIFSDSLPKAAVVGNDSIREKIEGLNSPGLVKVFTINVSDNKSLTSLNDLIEAQEPLAESVDEACEDDLSDIIYTSGTTGRPRGVELTHKNIVQNIIKTAMVFDINENDRILAFLPWAHAFGKTVDLHIFPAVGAAVGLVESVRTIAQNMLEVNPTVLSAVPKIFNKIYDTVHMKIEDKAVAKFLFERTARVAHHVRNEKSSFFDKLQYKILDSIIAGKVRAAFGNSLRFCISGGASLSKEVASFFDDFGVDIHEGCGMTEHAPILAVNPLCTKRIGAVGLPLPGVKIEISRDNDALDASDEKCGEIVVSSDCVMRGYHNDPAATAAAIDAQGRLHTGDMGYIDEDGFVYITGRVKEQYKLENGKYVVPTALEEKINVSPLIDLSVVFGMGKPYNVAIIRPSDECIAKFREDNHLENASDKELENNPKLRELIERELKTAMEEFRGYEKPHKFAICLEEFTIQNGMMTPALKIKRREVEKRFANIIQNMYRY